MYSVAIWARKTCMALQNFAKIALVPYRNPELRTRNPELRTRNPKLGTQNSELGTQNSELRTRNPELRTQNKVLCKALVSVLLFFLTLFDSAILG